MIIPSEPFLVHIGNNVTIFHNVTIAECDVSKKTIIEDNVLIGTGAVILNNVRIGKGSKIGANAVVCTNVDPGGLTLVCLRVKLNEGIRYE